LGIRGSGYRKKIIGNGYIGHTNDPSYEVNEKRDSSLMERALAFLTGRENG